MITFANMLMKIQVHIFLLILIIPGKDLSSQEQDSTASIVTVDAHYGAGLPFGDLKNRFAEHFSIGGNVGLLTRRRFYIGLNYDFIFGNQVKEDVLINLRTIEGGIIGRDMEFASVFLRERGHHISSEAGYLITLSNSKSESGLLVAGGIGLLSHKIRIVDDFNSVVQLFDPYRKGYDRLTAGWNVMQKIGYQYLSKDKLVNFRLTLSLIEAFTKDLRNYNYNQTEVTTKRLDIMTNLQIAWIVPIYLTKETRYY